MKKIFKIAGSVQYLLHQVDHDEKRRKEIVSQAHDVYKKSAANLINYLSLRSFDIRDLQRKLGYLGMSRLARAEAHVKASLKTTLILLDHLVHGESEVNTKGTLSIKSAEKLLKKHTNALLGEAPKKRRLRIMVTMPTEAANDYELVENMVLGGMDCARINCAHDEEEIWLKMIKNIQKASKKCEREVTVTMDLGGPKIRTGEMETSPNIRRFEPEKDEQGNVILPALIRLVSREKTKQKTTDVPVDKNWLKVLSVGDEVFLTDTTGEQRALKIVKITKKGVTSSCYQVVSFESGTVLKAKHGETEVGEISQKGQSLLLRNDDHLVLCKEPVIGNTVHEENGSENLACISCTFPQVFDDVEKGDGIYFDDGEIEGIIEEKFPDRLLIKVVHAKSGESKLKADKGINFPDSKLSVSGLTKKDRKDLKFIAKYADAVNFSFVNSPQDVRDILQELEGLGVKDQLGLILKIETKSGYDQLTKILFEAMKTSKIGVMIARGDLAIETGWERIGSIQREILAICNAAHVPVVWATQVLENLAKKGLPSRSEITDAVNASKADCVMLNKGPHIIEAIKLLDQIIRSSEDYQDKNAPMLPKLKKIAKEKSKKLRMK